MLPLSFFEGSSNLQREKEWMDGGLFDTAVYPQVDEYCFKLVYNSLADKRDLQFQNFRLVWIFDVLHAYLK